VGQSPMVWMPDGAALWLAEGGHGGGSGWHPRGFAQMRQGVRAGAEARAEADDVDKSSCRAPVWLRWRAKQESRSGEPFDDAHGCAADWAVPE
jgi:hypothetical protein